MSGKDKVLDMIDAELSELEENTPFLKRDGAYFSELQIKTAFRNVLYNTPLSERIAGLLLQKNDVLHDILNYWVGLTSEKRGPDRDDFYEVSNRYLENLDLTDKNDRLFKRANEEYNKFIDDLMKKSPEDIVMAANEIVQKDDILLLLEDNCLLAKQLSVLLTLEEPLNTLYDAWIDKGYSHMEILRDTMNELIDEQGDLLIRHQYDRDGKIPETLREYYAEYEEAEYGEAQEPEDGLEPC